MNNTNTIQGGQGGDKVPARDPNTQIGAAASNGSSNGQAARTLDAALAYLRAGLSIIPIARDGTKQPDGRLLPREFDEVTGKSKATWNPFKDHERNGERVAGRLPTELEVRNWFSRPNPPGVAVIGGAVS